MLRLKLPVSPHTLGTQCTEAVVHTMIINTIHYVYILQLYNTTAISRKLKVYVAAMQLWHWGHFSSHRGYRIEGSLEGRV